MARGTWHDPSRGQEQLGGWFREWIAGRADLADSTRALYVRLLDAVIDAPLSLSRPNGVTRTVHIGAQTLASVTPADVREWDSAVLADATRRATARWDRARNHPLRVNAAIRRWAAANGAPIAPMGRMPAAVREAWLAETGGVVSEDAPQDRNAGRTDAAQAYRLLHTGMAQAVADGLIPANPCRVKGASQRDSKDRTEHRTATPAEIWALADAMPERYRAAVIVAFCSGLRAGELFALQRRHVDLDARTLRVEQSLARPGTAAGRSLLLNQDAGWATHGGPAGRGGDGADRAHGPVHRPGPGLPRLRHEDRQATVRRLPQHAVRASPARDRPRRPDVARPASRGDDVLRGHRSHAARADGAGRTCELEGCAALPARGGRCATADRRPVGRGAGAAVGGGVILGPHVDGAGGDSAAPTESSRVAQQAADQPSRTQSTRPGRGMTGRA